MDNCKVKIFILGRDKVDWAIDRIRKETEGLLQRAGFLLTKNPLRASHIFCVWHSILLNPRFFWVRLLKKISRKKVIAVVTDDITSYPGKVEKLRKIVNVFIVPSQKACQYLESQDLKVYKIPFFVDPTIFKPSDISKQEICRKTGIDYEKIRNKTVIGSFQRDSLGEDLSKPKWQKNPDLLVAILDKLPRKDFILLLAGPRRHYIIKKCLEKKINFFFCGDYSYIRNIRDDILVNNLPFETINYLYNLTDIYIISSKSEGGPQQPLESALTKTLVLSTNVGWVPDFLHPDLIFKQEAITQVVEKIKEFMRNPASFRQYIDYNYQKAIQGMNQNILTNKYKELILDSR